MSVFLLILTEKTIRMANLLLSISTFFSIMTDHTHSMALNAYQNRRLPVRLQGTLQTLQKQ